MEPTTLGTGVVVAYLTKDGLEKLLGPTAEYLGGGLKDFTARRMDTIAKIFQSAQLKLKSDIDMPGVVPPKVLNRIVNDGSFSHDPIAIEYLGGVLASSRTKVGRDDRGAAYAQLIASLSTYQLRTHYLIYGTIRSLFRSSGYLFNMIDRPKMRIFLPIGKFVEAMDLNESEQNDLSGILNHIFFGLVKEGLLADHFMYGDKKALHENGYAFATSDGVCVEPSALGAELYLWGCGAQIKRLSYIFDENFDLNVDGVQGSVPSCIAENPA